MHPLQLTLEIAKGIAHFNLTFRHPWLRNPWPVIRILHQVLAMLLKPRMEITINAFGNSAPNSKQQLTNAATSL